MTNKVEEVVDKYLLTSNPLKKWLSIIFGCIFTFFSIIGVFVPGWPTVSWAVPAAFLFSISSERLFRWSLTNKFFGSAILEYYHTGKTIPKHAKLGICLLILLMVVISAISTFHLGDPGYGSITIIIVGLMGICYVSFVVKSRESQNYKSSKSKLAIYSILYVIMLLIPILYSGLGYVIATQSGLQLSQTCGVFEENTPSDWDMDDEDWYLNYANGEERIKLRQEMNVSEYQFPFEEVNFPSRSEGVTISGWYQFVDPESPTVIITHGVGTNGKCKHEPLMVSAMLYKNGINTLSIDLQGYGNSTVVDEYMKIGQIEYLDILGAVDYLIDSRNVSENKIGVMGISLGGIAASIAFSEDERISAIWLEAAPSDFQILVEDQLAELGFPKLLGGSAIRWVEVFIGVNPNEIPATNSALSAGERPMFLCHGYEDDLVPISHSQSLEKLALENNVNVTSWYVEGANHVDAIWSHTEEYEDNLTAFFKSLN
ncbi:MAG: DUF454 family protein [Candidatus Thermoplasmatota archaeon]|nr:DUF454 family protein [Candidatus Thermoplasmatota archaeon]